MQFTNCFMFCSSELFLIAVFDVSVFDTSNKIHDCERERECENGGGRERKTD